MDLDDDALPTATIGQLVKHFRSRVGWSQHDLAESIGVSDGMIGNVERGTRNLGVGNAANLIRVLDLSDDDARLVHLARQRAATGAGQSHSIPTVADRLTVVERRLDAMDEKLDRLLEPREGG